MLARMLGLGALIVTLAAAQARADTIHWYWQVEVNGQAVQTDRPIGVNPGDNVDIQLMADYDPYGSGFAYAIFGLETIDEFAEIGDVNISTRDGYGLNRVLLQGGGPGEFVDTDGGGTPDFIDDIVGFQAPMAFNSEFDGRDPLPVYRIGWSIHTAVGSEIPLRPVATLSGERLSHIYTTNWGESSDYTEVDEVVRFVPAPGGVGTFLFIALLCVRSRR